MSKMEGVMGFARIKAVPARSCDEEECWARPHRSSIALLNAPGDVTEAIKRIDSGHASKNYQRVTA
jgi:hypothetical protein